MICDQLAMSHVHARRRLHIDGLRAIAVMGVVLFHFGATWIPGGFVGVDVFFVISGFVISKSMFRDLENRQFSIAGFYERRARRILPAFFVVTLVSSVAAYLLLFPQQLQDYASSVLASAVSGANIYFHMTTNYFGPGAAELPLLHYWSLGVEEQFYLFFPWIMIGVFRWRPASLPMVLGILAVASLVACEIMRHYHPMAAFYWLPFRAFELCIGCVLAMKTVRFPTSSAVASAASGAGIAVTLASMLLIREDMAFPGLLGLVPCLGAALIIWGGEKVQSLPSRLLSSWPFLFLGQISYSLYLVHNPMVVFGRLVWPNASATGFLTIGVICSIGFGWLSYRFVEQSVIRRPQMFTRRITFAGAGVITALLVVLAALPIAFHGFPGRIGTDVNAILAYQGYDSPVMFRQGKCFLTPEETSASIEVPTCLPVGPHKVVLWGDSSMAQYYWGLAPLLKSNGRTVGQLTASACPPIVSLVVAARPNCKPFNDFAMDEIVKYKPDEVVMSAVWATSQDQLALLDGTIRQLQAANIKVTILGPPSYFRRPVPLILARRRMVGDHDDYAESDLDTNVSIEADANMRNHFTSEPSVNFVSVKETVCGTGCPIIQAGIPFHVDLMHLTRQGSDYYAKRLVSKILN